ncbi:MAG: LEPR-XLL domain-containing protein [Planctomycetes bacterium]|nr:LEPR-XLL domain-containing protein [Planctomycetota bacterium]
MAWASSAQRRGKFEALEPRQLLAGDVLVNVVGGNLRIEGDAEDNKIMIVSGADAGTFVVTGLDGTTLEGATDPITVSDVLNIRVNLGEGNDLAAIVGANVGGNVSIQTGAGDDRVLVGTGEGAAELAGVLPADLSVDVHGVLRIDTNGGLDHVAVDDAMAGRLSVHAGEDNDVVSLGSTAPLGDLTARLAVGHGVHVNLGAGNDELNIDQLSAHGGIVVWGGQGDNSIDANIAKAKAMLVASDGGVDNVSLMGLDVHHLGVHTGAGNDNVDVRDSVFKSLGVSLGDGDDTLTTANLVAKVAVFGGGAGEDTLDEAVASMIDHKSIQGFEIPPDVNVNELPNRRRIFSRLFGLLR